MFSAFRGVLNPPRCPTGAPVARPDGRDIGFAEALPSRPEAMSTKPEPFSITRHTHGTSEIVALAGELDMANAPIVAETLDGLADTARPVIVDLSELDFIDSSGIHAIVCPRPQQT